MTLELLGAGETVPGERAELEEKAARGRARRHTARWGQGGEEEPEKAQLVSDTRSGAWGCRRSVSGGRNQQAAVPVRSGRARPGKAWLW